MRVLLLSRSPGRAEVLARAEVDFVQVAPPFDDPAAADAGLRGVEAAGVFARELASQKLCSCTAAVLRDAGAEGVPAGMWAVAADTVCVGANGRALGKPETAAEAEAMLRGFIDAEHAVVTGLALGRVAETGGVEVGAGVRPWFEVATVAWGGVDAIDLGRYVASARGGARAAGTT